MKRCKHLNFVLAEESVASSDFRFVNGQPPAGGIGIHGYLRPSGAIAVECDDCGFVARYNLYDKRPVWVQKAWNALVEEQNKGG